MFQNKITAILLSTFITISILIFSQITTVGAQLTGIEVNVKQFGAKGDGITNDTKAISNAFNSAAQTKGIVFFPAGDYLVNTTITVPAGVSIAGESRESTTIKRIDASDTAIFNLNGQQIIRDIGFNSRINLYPTGDDITIEDCKITGTIQGIQNAFTINRLTISGTLFDGCGYGFLSNNFPSYDTTISNCMFINSSADDIEINSPSERVLIQNCNFKDNVSKSIFSGFGIGVAVHAKEITINNCNFFNMACQAIHCEDNSEVNITTCTFKNSGRYDHPGSPHSDIAVLSGAKTNISDCVFFKSDSGYSTMGIYNNNAIIKGCKFYEKWCGYSSSYYNCEFYGDSLLAAGSRLGMGIDSPGTTKIVSDCKFFNLAVGVEFGYLAAGSYGGTVQNCVFTNCDNGATSKRTSTITYAGSSEIVENNLFKACIVGVRLPNGGDAPRRNYTVGNNLFFGCKTDLILGEYIPGYERSVSDNRDLSSINNISEDKITLTTEIGNATTLIETKTVGIGVGNVPQIARDFFQSAIITAIAISIDEAATQTEVDAQVLALNAATTDFNSNIIAAPGSATVERLYGINRIETSIAIAKKQYTDKQPDAVVLTSANDFPDGLAGSGLAYKYNAPLLLVNKSVKDSQPVLDYITANLSKDKKIYILGGSSAVSIEVSDYITAQGYNIIRIDGNDRYETNQKIVDYLDTTIGTNIVITSGDDFADALSISSVADIKGYPVLLNGKDNLSANVSKDITNLKPTTVYLVGGTGALSDNIEAQIKKLDGNIDVVRLGGKDRYETSLKIASYFNFTTNTITVASGISFPDALSGSVLAARTNSNILLVDNEDITNQNVFINKQKITNIIVFGGEGVISGSTANLLKQK